MKRQEIARACEVYQEIARQLTGGKLSMTLDLDPEEITYARYIYQKRDPAGNIYSKDQVVSMLEIEYSHVPDVIVAGIVQALTEVALVADE